MSQGDPIDVAGVPDTLLKLVTIKSLKIDNCIIMSTKTTKNYNPSQNIWHKLKKYSKIGQDFKNVISKFAWFLTAIVNF